jgi:hypothetical protein
MNWLLKVAANTFFAYIISWVYFIFSLPFVVKQVGKVRGVGLNYGISWIVMLVVLYVLQKVNPSKDIASNPPAQ